MPPSSTHNSHNEKAAWIWVFNDGAMWYQQGPGTGAAPGTAPSSWHLHHSHDVGVASARPPACHDDDNVTGVQESTHTSWEEKQLVRGAGGQQGLPAEGCGGLRQAHAGAVPEHEAAGLALTHLNAELHPAIHVISPHLLLGTTVQHREDAPAQVCLASHLRTPCHGDDEGTRPVAGQQLGRPAGCQRVGKDSRTRCHGGSTVDTGVGAKTLAFGSLAVQPG